MKLTNQERISLNILNMVIGIIPSTPPIDVLIPGICAYATLHCKRDFVNVIKLRILRWRDYSGLPRWVLNNHKGFYQRKAEGSGIRIRVRDVITGTEKREKESERFEDGTLLAQKTKEGATSQGKQVVSRQENGIFSRTSKKNTAFDNHFLFLTS